MHALVAISRTNNAVEEWHNTMASLLDPIYPSVWKVIKAIRKEQKLTQVRIVGHLAGKEMTKQKKIMLMLHPALELFATSLANVAH